MFIYLSSKRCTFIDHEWYWREDRSPVLLWKKWFIRFSFFFFCKSSWFYRCFFFVNFVSINSFRVCFSPSRVWHSDRTYYHQRTMYRRLINRFPGRAPGAKRPAPFVVRTETVPGWPKPFKRVSLGSHYRTDFARQERTRRSYKIHIGRPTKVYGFQFGLSVFAQRRMWEILVWHSSSKLDRPRFSLILGK